MMTLEEIIASLLEQVADKQCFADPEDLEDILSKDIEVLREAAELLNKQAQSSDSLTLDELRKLDG